MSETKKKIKVTVKKHLPCPQCGKGNMFDYYNYPDEDDVCSDCDESPVTNVYFDSNKMDDALYPLRLDWSFEKPDDDQYTCIYVFEKEEEKQFYKVAQGECPDVEYFKTLDEAKRYCDRHLLDYGYIMLCDEDYDEIGYWGQFSCD